jgi:hypothetical protein
MSVSPFKTTLTNILLPNPVFSTGSIGGLAALSQISPGSFNSTQPTLESALNLGLQAPVNFSAGAPFGSEIFAPAVIPANVPVISPVPVQTAPIQTTPVATAPVAPAPPRPALPLPPFFQKSNREDGDNNNQADNNRLDTKHPLGGPPGQLKKLLGDDNRGPGGGDNRGPGPGNPGNGNGKLNRKGGF